MHIDIYSGKKQKPAQELVDEWVQFLFTHLDQYGDQANDIEKCINYVYDRGGTIVAIRKDTQLVAMAVVNDTGMSGYIPDHILVYVAVDKAQRGQGLGKTLMDQVFTHTNGDIALHVDFDNERAAGLYEKVGFKKKYIEMRYKRPASDESSELVEDARNRVN